jgi:serine/threonine protein kinase
LRSHPEDGHHRSVAEAPDETQHVPDGPVATERVPDGPDKTQHLAKDPVALPRFGRFQTLAELGAGAMGKVYRAHDDVLSREVAIKVLHGATDDGLRKRFLREAKAIGATLHPNVLAVYDAGTERDAPYLVMELASGSLRDRIAAGKLDVDAVRTIGIQIARALAAAHAAGILHRDVKPGNILVSPTGVWKLADFGIARTPDSTLTVAGQFLGSPAYAAPESLRAGEFSPASDVYGLGATLYEMIAGAPPHGLELTSIMRKLEVEAAPLPARAPASLASAVMAALARDPARRPSADAFAHMLAGDAAHATPPPRRNRALVIAALGAAALAAALIVVAIRSSASDDTAPQRDMTRSKDSRGESRDPTTLPGVREQPPAPPQAPDPPQAIEPNEPPDPPQPEQPELPPSVKRSDVLASCMNFQMQSQNDDQSVVWSGCPDDIVRKIECKRFQRDYTCNCLENGVQRRFFSAPEPPDFSSNETAARTGRTRCKMGFGN